MPEVPACLKRRYRALDNLIRDLSSSSHNTVEPPSDSNNVGVRLMCDFWNILKDDPDCNLTQEVQHCMGMDSTRMESSSNLFGMHRYAAYRGCCEKKDKKKPSMTYVEHRRRSPPTMSPTPGCRSSQDVPLSKVLCNLNEAASFDQKCYVRVKELMKAQEELKQQIQVLEEREKAGVDLLKQADNMWLCMEEAYKKKVSDSLERQKQLLKQLKEVEASANKWRKNEKDLEFQIKNMNRVTMDITENMNQKLNDVKIMDTEIENFKKRIESNSKDLVNTKKSLVSKREASDARLSSIANEIAKVKKRTQQEIDHKRSKEEEGAQYVKDARDDLQKICKVLLQKKIEHEDLRAERAAIIEELDLLNLTADNCKEKCKNRERSIMDEIKNLSDEIAVFKVKCTKCHASTDTDDVRKFCTDCPRCLEERDCKYGDSSCAVDPTMDCVCMGVKQKFLDNIFDNMYTVLDRKSKTQPGKAVADAVLNCLKRSTNGKLNAETRKILQDFVLSTVKKNLNLTIVGGAVKTRCEMDPETYKQLMLCLNRVEVPKAVKEDKGTESKKDPCTRWGHSTECNCPKGPKDCICTKKAPPPPNDPTPCPHDEDDVGETVTCPHKPGVCGPDCGMQGKPIPSLDPAEIASWRPDPCSGPSCSYSKNLKEAQFVLSPEVREPAPPRGPRLSHTPNLKPSPEHDPVKPTVKSSSTQIQGKAALKPCGTVKPTVKPSPTSGAAKSSVKPGAVKPSAKPSPLYGAVKPTAKPSSQHVSVKSTPKHSPIRSYDKLPKDSTASCTCSGVMRKPCPCLRDHRRLPRQRIIEEVMGSYNDISPIAKVARSGVSDISRHDSRCLCSDYPMQYINSKMSDVPWFCGCSSHYTPVCDQDPCSQKSRRKRNKNICRKCKCDHHRSMMRCGNTTFFAGLNNRVIFKSKTVKRTSKIDIREILCPKFAQTRDSKIEISVDTSTSILCSSDNTRLKSNSSLNTNRDIKSYNGQHTERNVCDTVKEFIKDVIVNPEDVLLNNLESADVEWITVEKLFQRVTSLTKSEHCSNDTINEVEMRCEVLEMLGQF